MHIITCAQNRNEGHTYSRTYNLILVRSNFRYKFLFRNRIGFCLYIILRSSNIYKKYFFQRKRNLGVNFNIFCPVIADHSVILTEDTDSFIIGERVWVGGTKPGQIAYIGETQFAPGEWAGIVLDEPIGMCIKQKLSVFFINRVLF